MVNERIAKLRSLMKDNHIDLYYIPTSDYHNSEYVGEHFRTREYMSGFTGSAGVMIVTMQQALLWSDGRYYVQAEAQTKDSEIIFKRHGSDGVESPMEFMEQYLQDGMTIGFDGRTVSVQMGEALERLVLSKQGTLVYDVALIDQIWQDRPTLKKEPAFLMDIKYVGESIDEKLAKVRTAMKRKQAKYHVITSLDDIAYILNIRGRDIPCTPVLFSYLLMNEEQVFFYVDSDKLSTTIVEYLTSHQVVIKKYDQIYQDIMGVQQSILLDPEIVNYALYQGIPTAAKKVMSENPTIMMKAIKNSVELENLRIAHIKDGVAVSKFMYWLKTNIGKIPMSEVIADEKITALRAQQEGFIEPSFDTISAYNANAAMMHYHATLEQQATLQPSGMLLVDSGGQYLNGTTDITRTFALGEVNPLWKRDYTLVLTGMSALARAKFLAGCSGINLDILARQPLWQLGIDYRCGTGHGVGFALGVHEGPHGIRWRKFYRKEDTPLFAGMVVTDEPGVYEAGSHGIRIENELVVKTAQHNEYGQFMEFETITFAPIDIDLIDEAYLDEATRNWLNAYHQQVFEKISPYLEAEEVSWLKQYTRAI